MMNLFKAAMIADGEFELAGYAPEDEVEAEELVISAYQFLIDSGAAWQLQGRIGRQAVAMIEMGLCSPAGGAS